MPALRSISSRTLSKIGAAPGMTGSRTSRSACAGAVDVTVVELQQVVETRLNHVGGWGRIDQVIAPLIRWVTSRTVAEVDVLLSMAAAPAHVAASRVPAVQPGSAADA